jgi:hypothetical protein
MVYAVAYSPLAGANELLKSHSFDDSKKLTAAFRSQLMEKICQKDHALQKGVGWAVRVMSPQDISSGMMRAAGSGVYNLNAQAHDTTIDLIREVMEIKKINITEVWNVLSNSQNYKLTIARFMLIQLVLPQHIKRSFRNSSPVHPSQSVRRQIRYSNRIRGISLCKGHSRCMSRGVFAAGH